MTLTIKTNNQWRDLVYRSDVPANSLASDFDYQNAEEVLDGFFEYHGHWYHLDQFTRSEGILKNWDGYSGDSYSSGVLIKLSSDGERVMCATYFS